MSRYRVVKVEDTKESITEALKEMSDAMLKGSGIGFDLTSIQLKSKKHSILKEIDQEYVKSTIGTRSVL